MIDASQGFIKDGPKNRLRAQDIHKIVDAFTRVLDIPGYSRTVPFTEIEKNECNLNLPRYIDGQKADDRQDIEGHLCGGIPEADIDALNAYWDVCPKLKSALFQECRPGYVELVVDKAAIKSTIFEHPEFTAFTASMAKHFNARRKRNADSLKELKKDIHPRDVITGLSESLLIHYTNKPLIDKYDVYQHLMDYWAETMQDDCYAIAQDGWKAEPYRIIEKGKNGKDKDKGWACDLVPKSFIVARYLAKEQAEIDGLTAKLEASSAALAALEEENGGDEGAFSELDKISKGAVAARLKEIKEDNDAADEAKVLYQWLRLSDEESELKKSIKVAEGDLDAKAFAKYPKLTQDEVKTLVVDDKWMARIDADIHGEMDRVSHALTRRLRTLAERYETSLPQMDARVADLEAKVNLHLERMGFTWN